MMGGVGGSDLDPRAGADWHRRAKRFSRASNKTRDEILKHIRHVVCIVLTIPCLHHRKVFTLRRWSDSYDRLRGWWDWGRRVRPVGRTPCFITFDDKSMSLVTLFCHYTPIDILTELNQLLSPIRSIQVALNKHLNMQSIGTAPTSS